MRVICTTTERYVSGDPKGGISVRRGSIYNVVDVKDQDYIEKYAWDNGLQARPSRGKWYELLELEGFHHESKFLEIPEDPEIQVNVKEEVGCLKASRYL